MAQRGGNLPGRPPEYQDEPVQPYWPLFIEKLLLAIIDAYPRDNRPARVRAADKKRQKRLEAALKALFGAARRKGPKRNYALHAAIAAAKRYVPQRSMATFEKEVLQWPKSNLTAVPSKISAIRDSAQLIEGNSQSSREERIEDFEVEHADYVQQIAGGFAHFEEEDMERDLFVAARLLRRWDVNLVIDSEALGMASLWGAKAPQLTLQSEEKTGDK